MEGDFWKLRLPNKVKVFLGKACQNLLAARDNHEKTSVDDAL